MWRMAVYVGAGVMAMAVSAAAYHGAFGRVQIEEQMVGPYSLVYREMRGTDLGQVGAITTELDALLEQNAVVSRRPFDVFYPQDTQPNEVGFVLTPDVASQTLARIASARGVKVRDIPRQRAMVARFPFKSRLSFLLGYMKVDPALRAYRAKAGYKDAPAYALNEGPTIAYMQPVQP